MQPLHAVTQAERQRPAAALSADLWVCSKGANLDLAGRNGAVGVNDDGQEGVHVHLLSVLGAHIDARQPAAIARVAVVPAHNILVAPHLLQHREDRQEKLRECLSVAGPPQPLVTLPLQA